MWQKEPEQMLRYRAATRFQTAYCPEISCGLAIKEEIEDAQYTEVTPENIDKLSGEEQLAKAQQQEEKEANSQPLDMNNDADSANNEGDNKSSVSEKETTQNKPKAQPLGKQEMPDMFKQM